MPALSLAPLQVAVKLPTPLALPPLRLRLAAVATPERASLVSQPAAGTEPSVYVAPSATPVTLTLGGVASRLMVTLAEFVPPALVTSQVRVVPAVSLSMVVKSQPLVEVMANSLSMTVQLTVTSLVYQPLSPSVPLTLGVITGGVLSRITSTSKAPISYPASWGRETPRWSVAGPVGAASIAGLPSCSAWVNVVPPLSARGNNIGSVCVSSPVAVRLHVLSLARL